MHVEPVASGSLDLPGGRALAWVEYGATEGLPLLYFHGWPGAGVEVAHGHEDARRGGFRLIAVDRPGMGRSGFAPGRRLVDWAGDIAVLLDALKIASVKVLGCSGGGPYALSVAHGLPDRVERVGLICPMGPPDHPRVLAELSALHRLALRLGVGGRLAAATLAPARWFLTGGVASPVVRLAAWGYRATKPPADQRVLADPGVLGAKVHAGQEAFRQGARGAALDGAILASAWGFDPGTIRVPVLLWHGERDGKVPPVMSRVLASVVPGARAVFYPDDGHSSIYVDHFAEILEAMR